MQFPLGEHVTLSNAGSVRLALLEAFAQHSEVLIDASALSRIDLSFVQVIESARAHAATTGRHFALTAPANPALAALLQRGGLLARASAADLDFWFHGERPQ